MARRRRSNRRGLVIAVVVGVLLIAVVGFVLAQGGGAPELPRETVEVRRQDLTEQATATGNAAPPSSRSLGFPAGGRLVEVAVRAGDEVAAGQLLGRIDDADARQAVAQAEAELAAAEARLADAEAGASAADLEAADAAVEQAEVATANARRAVQQADQAEADAASAAVAERDQAQAALDATRAQAAQEIATAEAAVRAADERVDAAEQAVGQPVPDPPPPPLVEARQELEGATARLAEMRATWEGRIADAAMALGAAEQRAQSAAAGGSAAGGGDPWAELDAARAGERVAEAQAAQSTQGSRAGQIVEARAAVDGARAAYDGARRQLQQTVLTAPVDGRVATVNGRVGELAGAEEPTAATTGGGGGDTAGGTGATAAAATGSGFVTLIETGAMEVEAGFAEIDAARLEPGQTAEVTFDALPGETLPGRVLDVDVLSTTVNNVVTYNARLALDAVPTRLRPGMTAGVAVDLRTAADALVVPAAALRQEDGESVATVLRGDTEETVRVAIGLRADGVVEILRGLEEGDVVVIPTVTATPAPPPGGPGGPA